MQRQKDYGLKDVDRFPQIEEFYHGTLDEEVNSKIILSWNEAKPIPGKLVPIKDYYPQLISHKGDLIKGFKFDIYNKT